MILKKQKSSGHYGVYAGRGFAEGELLFCHDEWIEDEKYGWSVLSVEEIEALDAVRREKFLRYSYDISFGYSIGTFDWQNARHVSNFMNHSCDPNMMYDYNDNIIAKRDIAEGEELTVDYGTFVVNFDQDFICACGSPNCRSHIRKDDWKFLMFEYQLHFPTFMHPVLTAQLVSPTVLRSVS